MEKVIKVNDLKKSFDDIKAINGISFDVKEGEMFGFIGPDGAGKTTTIRTLCGILKSFEGNVEILGYDLKTEKEKIKKKIGYLSQDFSLYKDLTVDENIEFFAEINKIDNFEQRRDELLEFTKMAEFKDRKAKNLSGGMKKKLALATTLIHHPKIIFLDEPTNGVDPVSRREFWQILAKLLKQKITIFMSTPYIDEAERCSRVALIDKGALLSVDKPSNLKKDADYKIFEVILSDVRKAYKLLKENKNFRIQSFGDRLHIYIKNDFKKIKAVILNKLKNNNINIKKYSFISPSLEDVFINYLTKYGEEK